MSVPKNPGDRAYGHGDEITFELASADSDTNADGELPRGYFVDFNGDGTVTRLADMPTNGNYDAVLKHTAAPGDDVTCHLRGAVRVAETGHGYDVIDTVDGDEIVQLG